VCVERRGPLEAPSSPSSPAAPEPVEKELPPDALAAPGTHVNELLDVTTKAMQVERLRDLCYQKAIVTVKRAGLGVDPVCSYRVADVTALVRPSATIL